MPWEASFGNDSEVWCLDSNILMWGLEGCGFDVVRSGGSWEFWHLSRVIRYVSILTISPNRVRDHLDLLDPQSSDSR